MLNCSLNFCSARRLMIGVALAVTLGFAGCSGTTSRTEPRRAQTERVKRAAAQDSVPATPAVKPEQIALECQLGQPDYAAAMPSVAMLRAELLALKPVPVASDRASALLERKLDLALTAIEAALKFEAIGRQETAVAYWNLLQSDFSELAWRMQARAKNGNQRAAWLGQEWQHRRTKATRWQDPPCAVLGQLNFDEGGLKFRQAVCVQSLAPKQALMLMERAAELGHPAAMEILGMLCANSAEFAAGELEARACTTRWLCAAADAGRKSAAANAAYALTGGKPTPAQAVKAAALYEMAASVDDAGSANNLGEIYEQGWIAGPNLDQAMNWYRRASDLGSGYGKLNLARLLWPKDPRQADLLIQEAAETLPAESKRLKLALDGGR